MLGITHIRCCLGVEADGEDSDEGGMNDCRHDWIKDVGDEHDSFGQEEEDGEHGNNDIVVRDAVQHISALSFESTGLVEEFERFYKLLHGRG